MRQTPAKKRQNVSQPIRWLETAADKAKFTQVTAVLTFLPKAQQAISTALIRITGMFLNLIKIHYVIAIMFFKRLTLNTK